MKLNYHFLPPNQRQTQLIQQIVSIQEDLKKCYDKVQPNQQLLQQFYSGFGSPKNQESKPLTKEEQLPTQRILKRDDSNKKRKYRQELDQQIRQKNKGPARQSQRNSQPVSVVPSYINEMLQRDLKAKQQRLQKQRELRQQLIKNMKPLEKKKSKRLIQVQFPVNQTPATVPIQPKLYPQKQNKAMQQRNVIDMITDPQQIQRLQKQATVKKKQFLKQKNKGLISQSQFNQYCENIDKQLQHKIYKQPVPQKSKQQLVMKNQNKMLIETNSFEQIQRNQHTVEHRNKIPNEFQFIKKERHSGQIYSREQNLVEEKQKQKNLQFLKIYKEEFQNIRKVMQQQIKFFHKGIIDHMSLQQRELANKLITQQLLKQAIPTGQQQRKVQKEKSPQLQKVITRQSNYIKTPKSQDLQNKSNSPQRPIQTTKIISQHSRHREMRVNEDFFRVRYLVRPVTAFQYKQDQRQSNKELPLITKFIKISQNDYSYNEDVRIFNEFLNEKQRKKNSFERQFGQMKVPQNTKLHKPQFLFKIKQQEQKDQPKRVTLQSSSKYNNFDKQPADFSSKKFAERLTFAEGNRFPALNSNILLQGRDSTLKEEIQQLSQSKQPSQFQESRAYNNEPSVSRQDFQTIQSVRFQTQFNTVRTVNQTKNSIVKSQFTDKSPNEIRRQIRMRQEIPSKREVSLNFPPSLPSRTQNSTITVQSQEVQSGVNLPVETKQVQPDSPKIIKQFMRPPTRKAPIQESGPKLQNTLSNNIQKQQLKRTSSFGVRTGSLKKLSQIQNKASSLTGDFMVQDIKKFSRLPDQKKILQELNQKDQFIQQKRPLKMKNLNEERHKRKLALKEQRNSSLEEQLFLMEKDLNPKPKPNSNMKILQRLQKLAYFEQQQNDSSIQQIEGLVQQQRHLRQRQSQNESVQYMPDFDSYSESTIRRHPTQFV